MNFAGRDLAKIGLPFQIIGGVLIVLGIIFHYAGPQRASWPCVTYGAPMHLFGDALFVFQMLKQKCL